MIYKIYISQDRGYEGPLILKKEKKVIGYIDNFVNEIGSRSKLMVIEHDTKINADCPACLITKTFQEDYKRYRKVLKNRSRVK